MGSKTWSAGVFFIFMFKSKYSTTEVFESVPIKKALWIMALPAIAGQLISLIYNIADTFFIGRVNNPLMITATSLTFPVFSLVAPLAIVAGTGAGTLVSRLLGVYEKAEAKRVGTFGVYLSLCISVIFSVCIFIFMDPLLKLLGTSDNAYLFTKQYMTCVVVLGGVPTIMSSTLANLIRSSGYSKYAGFGISMGGIINIILDPIFMFVLLPDGYEVVGAGLATMLSNIASCIYFILKIRKHSDVIPVGFSWKCGLPTKAHIKEVILVGIPAASTTLLFDINNLILNRLMSAYGDIAVAAIGMTLKLERFSLNTCVGLCLGMTPVVAYNFSAHNYDRMSDAIKISRRRGIIISIISICFYEICAVPFTQFFINDPETVALGAAFLRRRAIASIVMFLSFYMPHVYQGFGEGRINLIISNVRYLIFCIPALFICNHFMGMYGLAWAQFIGDILTATVTGIYFRYYMKGIMNGTRVPKR